MGKAPTSQLSNAGIAPTPVTVDFPSLYRQEFAYAWRTLRRLGVHERDLPDLVHDFFIVVFRHLSDYDPARAVRPWLFGIAFRVVSDYRRSSRFAREALAEAPDIADRALPADERVAEQQALEQVMRVLEALDLDRRAVLVMHDIEGLPVPEIAAALTIPVATAYSRLRLAREDVAAAIKRLRARASREEGQA
jgi:RNA polymerase sigma-70 factor, ECF subfamily